MLGCSSLWIVISFRAFTLACMQRAGLSILWRRMSTAVYGVLLIEIRCLHVKYDEAVFVKRWPRDSI